MKNRFYFFILLTGILFSDCSCVVAQNICIDTNRINPYFICTDVYEPICGCDGNVYRSICAAYNQAGLNYWDSFQNGGCANFDFDITPTLVEQDIDFGIYLRNKGAAYYAIFDVFGHKKHEENLGFIYSLKKKVSVAGYYRGVYIFYVQVEGEGHVRKFVKANDN